MSTSSTEAPPTAAAYVYGVVRKDEVPSIQAEGVADAPVQAVAHGDLAALVSKLPPEKLRVRRRDLVSHLRVLEETFESATVVPCAFGMVLSSEDAVRGEFLEPRHEELRAMLHRLDGKRQLNVRIAYDQDVVLQEIVESDPNIAQLRERTRGLDEDTGYGIRMQLGELVAGAFNHMREQEGRALLERLSKKAVDVAVEDPGEDVVKASFLVADKQSELFDRELERIAEEEAPRLRIELVGPLPPAAFATVEQGAWDS